MCNPVTTEHPAALLAKGEQDGFEWEVTSNGIGYRCGYVRIPLGHPWHGKGYDDVEADVHGGLTFAEPDVACGAPAGPDGASPDSGWWLGFDCAHGGDAVDPDLCEDGKLRTFYQEWNGGLGVLGGGSVVRTTEYVEAECRRLCEQARAASRGAGHAH